MGSYKSRYLVFSTIIKYEVYKFSTWKTDWLIVIKIKIFVGSFCTNLRTLKSKIFIGIYYGKYANSKL